MFSATTLDSHVIASVPMPTAAAGCSGFNVINPLCQAGNLLGGVASSGINSILSGLSQWVASGAEWLLAQIGNVLISTTTIDLSGGWFESHYLEMTKLAGLVVLPLLLVSTMQAVYQQSASQLIRAFLVQLPLALLLGVVAVQIVSLCLSATDAMCTAVAGGSGSAVSAMLTGVSNGLMDALADPTMASFVLVLVGLLVAVAAFVLWLELLVRAAAVYVAVLFLPLALATLVWPSISHWCRRLVETLTALILSKFVIVATLSLAASALASGTAGTGNSGAGFASVLAGGALLVLATFVPFSILKLIPMVEAGAVSHLEGARQRGMAPLTTVPRTAAMYALKGAMSTHQAAQGAARLAAQSGPPGTGGVIGGGGGGGGGGSADLVGKSDEERAELSNSDNGGCIPGNDDVMLGLPLAGGADPHNLDIPEYEPYDRGPIPLLPAAGSGAGEATGSGAGTGSEVASASESVVGAGGGTRKPFVQRFSSTPLVPINPPGSSRVVHAFGTDERGMPFITYIPRDDELDGRVSPEATT